MKVLLSITLLFASLSSWSQSRPGGGPDEADWEKIPIVNNFLVAVGKNLRKCSGNKNVRFFQNVAELANFYMYKNALRKELIECTAEPLPAEYGCVFEGEPAEHLSGMLREKFQLQAHLSNLRVKGKEADSVLKFLGQLDAKLNKNAKE